MTEEQIKEAAEKYAQDNYYQIEAHSGDVMACFVAGTKFAMENEWIDVSDPLPDNLSEVNVCLKSGYVTSLNYGETSGFFNAMSNTNVSTNNPVTHWQPP